MRVAQALLLFLLAVVIGRLMLERTGVGLAILLFLLPVIALILVAMLGWRLGLPVLAMLLVAALLARLVFVAAPGSAWILFIVVPVVAVSITFSVAVVRQLVAKEDATEDAKEER